MRFFMFRYLIFFDELHFKIYLQVLVKYFIFKVEQAAVETESLLEKKAAHVKKFVGKQNSSTVMVK